MKGDMGPAAGNSPTVYPPEGRHSDYRNPVYPDLRPNTVTACVRMVQGLESECYIRIRPQDQYNAPQGLVGAIVTGTLLTLVT